MDRPLPYLIGSQAFMEQDDVGLGDLSSDGKILIFGFFRCPTILVSSSCSRLIVCPEVSVDSDRESVLESEDGKEVVVRQTAFLQK